MTKEALKLDIQGRIATVTMNRPEVHNAFNAELIAELTHAWDVLAGNDGIIAVVLRGAGKSFSAGADLNWMKEAADFTREQNRTDALALANMLHKLYELPQVTIACIQGAAMGGGMGLLSCCDIVIADRNTKLALSEVKLGLIPATISPYVLRAMGERQAKRYFQTGERFDGEKGHELGLVHEVAESLEDMESILNGILNGLKANGPDAMRAAKHLAHDYATGEVTLTVLEETSERIAAIRVSDEAKEGLTAFLEKRKANWTSS